MFEVKRGFFLEKRTFVYLCMEMRFFFCGWLMGFLPYVATNCTADKKKNTQKGLLRQALFFAIFSQWNSGKLKKATRTSSADFRSHRRCWLILPRHDQGRSNLCIVRLEIPNRSKNEKTKSPSTCKQTKKKKRIRIDFRKSQAGVIWNFAVALSLAKPFNTGETFCGPAGTKITIV